MRFLFLTMALLAGAGSAFGQPPVKADRARDDETPPVTVKPGSPWLGVSRWLANEREVVLLGVLKDGPAGQAGLLPNDVIIAIAGRKIRSLPGFQQALNNLKADDTVQIEIERKGQRRDVSVKLEPLPEDGGIGQFRAAAFAGSPWAMTELGLRYAVMDEQSSFVKRDPVEGAKWFERAVSAGHSVASIFLGLMLVRGEGVPRDHAKAYKLFTQVRNKNEEDAPRGLASAASNQLGLMYLSGLGVERDRSLALRCFQDAANQGSPAAMHRIGFMFEYGIGVSQDTATAFSWYRRAEKLEYEPAKHSLLWLTVKEAVESGASSADETKPKK